jgi:hypothetical protein
MRDYTKMTTAEEYAHTQYLKRREEVGPGQFYPEPPSAEQIKDMIEFAKLHVEAAIKTCIEEAPSGSSTDTVSYEDVVEALKDCYPLENIK